MSELTAKEKIGRFFCENPKAKLTPSEVAERFNLKLKATHDMLNELANEGWVVKRAPRKSSKPGRPQTQYSLKKRKIRYLPPSPAGQGHQKYTPAWQDRFLMDTSEENEYISLMLSNLHFNKIPQTEAEFKTFLQTVFRQICHGLGLDKRTIDEKLFMYGYHLNGLQFAKRVKPKDDLEKEMFGEYIKELCSRVTYEGRPQKDKIDP